MKKAVNGMKNDPDLMHWQDLALAMSLLTRIPIKVSDTSRNAQAAWAYPLVGVVPAGLASISGLFVMWLGWNPSITALIALGVLIFATGAMHEDGLSDTADGFWGGWTRERRLEIMKDSRIGAYGVIALVLSLGMRWAALNALFSAGADVAVPALLTAAMMSRAAMPVVMTALPHARDGGLSHTVGRISLPAALLAVGLSFGLGVLLLGWAGLTAALCAAAVTVGCLTLTRRKIGGQTGDILGATQQTAEIAVLLVLIP